MGLNISVMEHTFIRVNAINWFNIAGRGLIALIDVNQIPVGRNLLVGDHLYIDDKLYVCNGIESASHNSHHGILVREIVETSDSQKS